MNLQEFTTFLKHKGFFFPSSDIYDGYQGFYDYGPLGVLLINNLKNKWWNDIVKARGDIVPLDSSIIMNPEVWKSSGHTTQFSDPYVICNKTGETFRVDHLFEDNDISLKDNTDRKEIADLFEKNKDKFSFGKCDVKDISQVMFSELLVKTMIGFDEKGKEKEAYLRGETCQGIYVNFKNIVDSMRMTIPFGVAQIGKAFRNEISPRKFLYRTREFEQMEMQYFVYPADASKHYRKWREDRMQWLCDIGFNPNRLKLSPHRNLIFYAKEADDILFEYEDGNWIEIEGIHNRGDYDLKAHSKGSSKQLMYKDRHTEEEYTPFVIETSIGVGRLALSLLINSYEEEELSEGDKRSVLRLHKDIAPFLVSVLPLSKNEDLSPISKKVFDITLKNFSSIYDDTGSIGKRYRRQDEIGTPYCVTIDFDSLNDNQVTVRKRDDMTQDRVPIDQLVKYIKED